MSEHMTEWLGAYRDGELRGARLQHVETHLLECPECQAELASLEGLANLLHRVPAPEFTPPERFAREINLLLPQRQVRTSRKKIMEIGWWMIPVGLLAIWVFIGTSFWVNDLLAAAHGLGLMPGISDWLVWNALSEPSWSAALGQFGVLSGKSLDWAGSTEAFTRTSLLEITWEISIALLYLGWIAIWWTRHQRHTYSQLIKG